EICGWRDFGNVEVEAFLINFNRSGRRSKIGNRQSAVEIRSDRLQVTRDYCPRGLHDSDFCRTPVRSLSAVILEDNSWHKPLLEPLKLCFSRNLPQEMSCRIQEQPVTIFEFVGIANNVFT